jgi:heme-degrading monooxygenase HmoA
VYARLTTTTLAPDEPDASADVFEAILPVVRDLDGFAGMLVLSELEGRRIVALSLWESRESLEEAEPVMERLRDAETVHRGVDAQETAAFRVSASDRRDRQ